MGRKLLDPEQPIDREGAGVELTLYRTIKLLSSYPAVTPSYKLEARLTGISRDDNTLCVVFSYVARRGQVNQSCKLELGECNYFTVEGGPVFSITYCGKSSDSKPVVCAEVVRDALPQPWNEMLKEGPIVSDPEAELRRQGYVITSKWSFTREEVAKGMLFGDGVMATDGGCVEVYQAWTEGVVEGGGLQVRVVSSLKFGEDAFYAGRTVIRPMRVTEQLDLSDESGPKGRTGGVVEFEPFVLLSVDDDVVWFAKVKRIRGASWSEKLVES
jgi:hypothetical protein